ncbi:MAG: TetR/AcrR family transcriptional regulator [Candidatus Rifleibacteriota bacterium]
MAKSKTKREKLIDSALDMFFEKGYERTTIDDIVNRAECGKGTFYRYFSNKEKLVEILNENFILSLSETLKKKCKPELEPKEYMFALIKSFLKVFKEHSRFGLIKFEIDMRLSQEQRNESAKKVIDKMGFIKEYFKQAIEKGKVKNFNPETIIHTIIGSAHYFLFREFKLGIPFTETELKEAIDIIFYGVKAE